MNTNKQNTRKKFLVDREVQGALMGRIVRQWLLFFAALFIALPAWELALSKDPFTPASQAFAEALKHTAPVFVLLIALIPAFVYDTMKLSNRFSGPMCRLRQAIRNVADGKEVRQLSFRDGDFWGDVAGDFNRMLDRVREDKVSGQSEDELAVAGNRETY